MGVASRRRGPKGEYVVLLRVWEVQQNARSLADLGKASREALAGFFGVSQSRMSRYISQLLEQDLVQEEARRLPGFSRRVATYQPAPAGAARAQEIDRQMRSTRVTVGAAVHRLGDLALDLPGRPSMAEVWRFVETKGFDRESFIRTQTERVAALTGQAGIPRVDEAFIGREEECDKLRGFLAGPQRGLVVAGIPGIGKTTLVVHVARDWLHGGLPYWFDVKEESGGRDILGAFGVHLLGKERPRLERFLSSLQGVKTSDAMPILLRELAELDGVIVFDNAHRAGEEARTMIGQVLAAAGRNRSLKVVLVTREAASTTEMARTHLPDRVGALTVGPLSRSAAERLWRRLGGKLPFDLVWDSIGGHPQLFSLASTVEDEAFGLSKLANEQLLGWLDREEREAVEMAAVMRHPVQLEAFDALGLKHHSAVERLVSRRFLKEEGHGLYSVHDSVREMVLRASQAERIHRLDNKAASYWSSIGGARALQEAAFHLGRTLDHDSIRRFVVEHGVELSSAGFVTTLDSLLSTIHTEERDVAGRPAELIAEERLVRGGVLAARGKMAEAIDVFARVRSLAGASPWAVARAQVEGATMLQRLGRREEAREWLKGVSVPIDAPAYEEARLLHLVGSAFEALDDFAKARKFHEQCAAVQSRNAKPLGNFGLGRVLVREGKPTEALIYLREAEKDAQGAVEMETLVASRVYIADCMMRHEGIDLKLYREAAEVSMGAARLADEQGLLRLKAYALHNLAAAMMYGKLGSGEEEQQEALQIFKAIDEPVPLAYCQIGLGRIRVAAGDLDAANVLAVEILRLPEDRIPGDQRARLIALAANLMKSAGDVSSGRTALLRAIEIAKRHGLVEYAKQMEDWLKDYAA